MVAYSVAILVRRWEHLQLQQLDLRISDTDDERPHGQSLAYTYIDELALFHRSRMQHASSDALPLRRDLQPDNDSFKVSIEETVEISYTCAHTSADMMI